MNLATRSAGASKGQWTDWNARYKWILIYNQVIDEIDDAPLGNLPESMRAKVKGDALAQRGMDYFL